MAPRNHDRYFNCPKPTPGIDSLNFFRDTSDRGIRIPATQNAHERVFHCEHDSLCANHPAQSLTMIPEASDPPSNPARQTQRSRKSRRSVSRNPALATSQRPRHILDVGIRQELLLDCAGLHIGQSNTAIFFRQCDRRSIRREGYVPGLAIACGNLCDDRQRHSRSGDEIARARIGSPAANRCSSSATSLADW